MIKENRKVKSENRLFPKRKYHKKRKKGLNLFTHKKIRDDTVMR